MGGSISCRKQNKNILKSYENIFYNFKLVLNIIFMKLSQRKKYIFMYLYSLWDQFIHYNIIYEYII